MDSGKSEREAQLEARIKMLEAAETNLRRAGPVEQAWALLLRIIPPWLVAISVGVFIAFHGFTYFIDAQMSLANSDLSKAQAALKDAEMRAKTADAGGDTVTLATIKANLNKLKAEAERAKAEADAQTQIENGVSMRLATVKAELEAKEAAATKARLAAEAAMHREGGDTLEARGQRAKLVVTELEAAKQRSEAESSEAMRKFGFREFEKSVIRGLCAGNHFASEMNCPSRYFTVPQMPSIISTAVVDTPSPSPSTELGGVSVSPDATPAPTRKTLFNCSRASLPVDFVICASPRLMEAEARLEDAYNAAKAAQGDSVHKAQVAWIKNYARICGLEADTRPDAGTIRAVTPCIGQAIENRIQELRSN